MNKKLITLFFLTALVITTYWVLPLVYGNEALSGDKETGVLTETRTPSESTSRNWWLQSGGQAVFQAGSFRTLLGALPADHEWRRYYLRQNPLDSNNGYNPQNIFRLFSRTPRFNPTQKLEFAILSDIPSASPNKNANSGVFLYTHYRDAGHYYLAGLTTDGRAVVVKRHEHIFYTLAEESVITKEHVEEETLNLLPQRTPITLRTSTRQADGVLDISLWINGELVLEAVDDAEVAGPILEKAGLVGVRSDFIDVEFIRYQVEE